MTLDSNFVFRTRKKYSFICTGKLQYLNVYLNTSSALIQKQSFSGVTCPGGCSPVGLEYGANNVV